MSAAMYRDGDGISWQADPAAVGKPTYAYLHNRLMNAAGFLRNTKQAILPGNCTSGYAAATAEGGAGFWLYQPFESGVSHRLVDPRQYEGILSPLFCEAGLIGRVVSIHLWAIFDGDIYPYMPGMDDDDRIGAADVVYLYLAPSGLPETVSRTCSFFEDRHVFTFSINKSDGGCLWCRYRDTSVDPGAPYAAAVKMLVECGPVFDRPSY